MNVLVTLDPTLGISLGPNFTLSTDIGSVVPASATKSQLFAGISVIVNDLATVIQVISEGECTNTLELPIIGASTTTTTSTSTTSTSTSSSTTTTTSTNILELGLRLTWDNITNVPVADVNSISDWNIFFDLPTNGTPFTSVDVDTNTVTLFGGSGITLKDSLFDDNIDTGTHLNSISDDASCVVEIGYDVFGDELNNGCYNLTSASFPIVTIIGDYAFIDCEGLITLDLPSCINLGVSCFASDITLTTLVLPFNSFTELTEGIFSNCQSITSLSFPNVNIIGHDCFDACLSLSTLLLDYSGITDIADRVFEGTAMLSFNFPNVLTVGEYSFANSNVLTSIDLASVQTIGVSSIFNCPLLDTISIPSCTSLGDQCCVGDTSLININAPLLQNLGQSCFQQCSSLVNVVFNNLLTMGNAVFNACPSLVTVSLPLVDSAGASAFNTCLNLQTVYIPSVLSVGAACFNACNSITDIDLSSCTNLGGSVLDNNVFAAIFGQTINLTIPIGLMTCNGGLPDGDIQYLQVHNTVTIITV